MRREGTAGLEVSRTVAAVMLDAVVLNLRGQGSFLELESAARSVYEASYEDEISRLDGRA